MVLSDGVSQKLVDMLASEIMTHDVITVRPDMSISALAGLLASRGISAVPVISGDRLVGIVSEGDLLRRANTHYWAPPAQNRTCDSRIRLPPWVLTAKRCAGQG
jgi:CBS-domain-containing membrane protein